MSRSDVLVDADWWRHADDPGVVIVEVDEDTSAYDKGHNGSWTEYGSLAGVSIELGEGR